MDPGAVTTAGGIPLPRYGTSCPPIAYYSTLSLSLAHSPGLHEVNVSSIVKLLMPNYKHTMRNSQSHENHHDNLEFISVFLTVTVSIIIITHHHHPHDHHHLVQSHTQCGSGAGYLRSKTMWLRRKTLLLPEILAVPVGIEENCRIRRFYGRI